MWPPCRGRIVNQQESSWAAISFSDSPPPPPPPPPRTPLLLLLPSHPLPSHPPSPLCSPKVFCGPCAHPGHTHTHSPLHARSRTYTSATSYRPYQGMLCVAFTPSPPRYPPSPPSTHLLALSGPSPSPQPTNLASLSAPGLVYEKQRGT